MLHILKELNRLPAIGQWVAVCSCGHESFDASKVEAVNWHREHIDEAKKKSAAEAPTYDAIMRGITVP